MQNLKAAANLENNKEQEIDENQATSERDQDDPALVGKKGKTAGPYTVYSKEFEFVIHTT